MITDTRDMYDRKGDVRMTDEEKEYLNELENGIYHDMEIQEDVLKLRIENEQLEKENAELKEQNRSLLESCEGATMMYKDLCKAKEIIKKLRALYLSPIIANEDVKRQDEILNEVEQFLKA